MYKRKTHNLVSFIMLFCVFFTLLLADLTQAAPAVATESCFDPQIKLITPNAPENIVAKKLGWTKADNRCGGYYLEPPYAYSNELAKDNLIQITSTGPVLFAQHGTSILQGNVTATQEGQEVIANKACIYRDPQTNKLIAMDLFGNVHLREPESLVLAEKAHLDYVNHSQALDNIIYRTTIYSNPGAKPGLPSNADLQKERKVTHLSAWGQAREFSKVEPKIYEFQDASYSTCPPDAKFWQIKASHIVLNKNTGRGSATHARVYLHQIPVFYVPYMNFAIDDRRQTGFLHPTIGTSGKFGPYAAAPFYWNMAPNYDDTITPTFMSKRGWQFNNLYRYLFPHANGRTNLSIIPNDKAFSHFQTTEQEAFGTSTNPITIANLNRLQNAGQTRGSLSWQNNSQFDQHWFSNVDYNYVSDDYYLRDFRTDINEVTQNQLLQTGNVTYRGSNWNFMTRIQQYQTLHPVDSVGPFQNQYRRLPQFIVEGDYPDQKFGLDYFVMSDLTHFTITPTPGEDLILPVGNRLHAQPGVSLPLNWPYLYVTPRLQFALTEYDLGDPYTPVHANIFRYLPIFDIGTGMFFDRYIKLFGYDLQQTLEPQVYYTYVPYRNQTSIPNFDTTLNTLTFDQLFTYNRFSGLDRFGDANQIAVGFTSRFLDTRTAEEKIRFGIGEIFYFKPRLVTLCTDNDNCIGEAALEENRFPRSPISAMFNYILHPGWALTGNAIWNSKLNEMNNESLTLSYSGQLNKMLSVGYSFVRLGDVIYPNVLESDDNNLKQITFSFGWPVFRDWSMLGKATKSINRNYFQTVVFGLQYDSCCWAIRAVAGRSFVSLRTTTDNLTPQFTREFYIQFALRGVGSLGTGTSDPNHLISSSIGSSKEFGHDY